MNKSENILILGAGLMQKLAILAGKNLGFNVVVIDANPDAVAATTAAASNTQSMLIIILPTESDLLIFYPSFTNFLYLIHRSSALVLLVVLCNRGNVLQLLPRNTGCGCGGLCVSVRVLLHSL